MVRSRSSAFVGTAGTTFEIELVFFMFGGEEKREI